MFTEPSEYLSSKLYNPIVHCLSSKIYLLNFQQTLKFYVYNNKLPYNIENVYMYVCVCCLDEMARLEETARKVAEEAKQDKPTKLQFVRYVSIYLPVCLSV